MLEQMMLKTLKGIRNRDQMSQEFLAYKIGIETSTLSRWESGSRSPSMHNFISWVNALGCTLSIQYKDGE
tara:strand:+ start:267 stop:476 length:210 start_codon:yes stop_codon:yes gene_type:complete